MADHFKNLDPGIVERTQKLVREELAKLLPELKKYRKDLEGKRAAIYVGGAFKAFSLIKAFRHLGMIHGLRAEAEKLLPQMTHCKRCRADAVGLLCNDRSVELAPLLGSCARTAPGADLSARPYVAVGTREGMFTWQGAVLAAAVVAFPLVYRSARAAFEGVDENLENAARTLGASEMTIFFRVSLPLALRGLLAGVMLALARAMGEFGATLMVAGNLPGKTQTLSLAVYSATQAGNDSLANELVLLISVVCVALLMVVAKIIKPKA